MARIYIVEQEGKKPRLIRASFASAAIRFVATPMFKARVPKMEEYGELVMSGVKIEEADKAAD